jgi:hypothetical protein
VPSAAGGLPLELVLAEAGGSLHGLLRWRAGGFDEATAERLAEEFVAVLEAVAADPGRPVGDLLPVAGHASRTA